MPFSASTLCPLAKLVLPLILLVFISVSPGAAIADSLNKVDDVGIIQWPAKSRFHALIVANSIYKATNPQEQDTSLDNLSNACGDGRAIGESLLSAGWRTDDIVYGCDQSSGSLNNALTNILAAIQKHAGDEKQFTIVYLTGHGMQVGKNAYFFGVNARPDMYGAASTLIANPDQALFSDQSTRPVDFIISSFGSVNTKTTFVVVFDACRKDDLYDKVRGALLDQAKDKSPPEIAHINDLAQAVTAPSGGGKDVPWGSLVLFGSRQGYPVDDDNGIDGHSRMASGMKRSIEAVPGQAAVSKKANEVIGDAVINVTNMIQGIPYADEKVPDPLGYLTIDPCVTYCSNLQARENQELRDKGKLFKTLNRGGSVGGQRLWLASDTHISVPQPDLAISDNEGDGRLPGSSKSLTTVEVFWCSAGDSSDSDRRQLAFALRNNLTDLSPIDKLGVIKVTDLSKTANEAVGYQVNDNRIVYNRVDRALGIKVWWKDRNLNRRSYLTGSPGYIAAFYCQGAYNGPVAATLYLQTPTYSSLAFTSKIVEHLRISHPDINTIPQTEVRLVSPNTTQLRFFDQKRKQQACELASELSLFLGTTVKPVLFSRLANPRSVDQFEVWLGVSDINAIQRQLLAARPGLISPPPTPSC